MKATLVAMKEDLSHKEVVNDPTAPEHFVRSIVRNSITDSSSTRISKILEDTIIPLVEDTTMPRSGKSFRPLFASYPLASLVANYGERWRNLGLYGCILHLMWWERWLCIGYWGCQRRGRRERQSKRHDDRWLCDAWKFVSQSFYFPTHTRNPGYGSVDLDWLFIISWDYKKRSLVDIGYTLLH